MEQTPIEGIRNIGPTRCLPIGSYNKQSCNIECCGNKMHQIVANMNVDILICTTQIKSTAKENYQLYIMLASFILDMGHSFSENYWTPTPTRPIIIQF